MKEEILPWAGGNSPNLWTNMQANQDLWHEARNIKGEIASIEKAVRAFG
jgi:plasmid maintenance system antidote protein VapI